MALPYESDPNEQDGEDQSCNTSNKLSNQDAQVEYTLQKYIHFLFELDHCRKIKFWAIFYHFFGLLFGSLPSVSTSRNLEAGVLETRKVARTRRRKNKLIVCELVISQFNLSGRLEENDVK